LLLFKGNSGKKIEADFNGGEISSDAGLLFLREVEERIGLISKMADSLRDRRHPGYVQHQLLELFRQRIFQIAGGYEDGCRLLWIWGFYDQEAPGWCEDLFLAPVNEWQRNVEGYEVLLFS